ncbi:DUF6265 family protein [Actomonas aquatica]|uniref:DUF6265 family protein n=1 Tax=Actomonas aquatica TaxID=2866162 RepID=A0ABZ1C790_9BACT|nr:DUF6265 family protein [Opitutus sp. WL0086]WRQ87331.1 DUF6265 family protein [Opitutus sp. WL0086]
MKLTRLLTQHLPLILLVAVASVRADDPVAHDAGAFESPEVLRAADAPAIPPPATLADLAWLVGAWQGALDDNHQEAYVFPAAAGQLPGFARGWTPSGGFLFSEANTFVEIDGTLEYRVKHFTPEFHGVEPRDGYERHRLLAHTGNTWFFENITFRRDDDHHHTVAVRIQADTPQEFIIMVRQRRVTAPSAIPPLVAATVPSTR